jgi:hypothetical protein
MSKPPRRRGQDSGQFDKSQVCRYVSAELKRLQDAVPGIIQRKVKEMVAGVYQMIEEPLTRTPIRATETLEALDPHDEDA